MPLNVPGLLVPFQLLFNPRLVLPSVVVKDIRHLDFTALYKAGYRGAVFDKDNCLTRPHKDTIVPEIQDAWQECRKTFGEDNILIVSNSAGTYRDPGEIQCESVTYHTGVPVLRHKSFKPAYSCITAIRGYFSSLRFPIRDEELVIIGDRVFTDVVLANRMRQRKESQGLFNRALDHGFKDEGALQREKDTASDGPRGPLAIWTTDVWEKESMALRWCEKRLVDVVQRWTYGKEEENQDRFVREYIPPPVPTRTNGVMAGLFGKWRKI